MVVFIVILSWVTKVTSNSCPLAKQQNLAHGFSHFCTISLAVVFERSGNSRFWFVHHCSIQAITTAKRLSWRETRYFPRPKYYLLDASKRCKYVSDFLYLWLFYYASNVTDNLKIYGLSANKCVSKLFG